MKAAVIYKPGEKPKYTDFTQPIVENEAQVLISVKSVAIKNLDKSQANGKHYSITSSANTEKIVGGDGVGILNDGTRIYAVAERGMLAEKALVKKSTIVKIPDALDDSIASALPNAIAGSAMALRFRANMKGGETVLINGATGFTGKVAIQIAKHYGAKKIIVTGRNEQSLNSLLALGADVIIALKQSDEEFIAQIKEIHNQTHIDIIIDYLWGHSAEMILTSLRGNGTFTNKISFVSIGAISGDLIQLSAQTLRSIDLQLSGSGLGSWTKAEVAKLFSEILPEMFQLAATKKLVIETFEVELKDVEEVWEMDIPDGKRLVIKV